MRNFTFAQSLGYLFYIASPNEASFEKLEDIPDYLNEVGPLFVLFAVAETALLAYKKTCFINDTIASVSQGIIEQSLKLGLGWMNLVAYIWVYENWRIATIPWNSVWNWWFCLLAVDFGYYWLHRASHEINILWAAHQVHHSSEHYNLSTALRQSLLQNFSTWMFYLPVALVVPPPIFVVHHNLNLIYQFWIHTEIVKTLGPLEYIINTPSHHRVHHGRNRYCIDKNYGGFLIIWDRLFGTFEAEGDRVVYGLTHPVNAFNPITVQFCHYAHIWNTFWKTEGISNKLSVLIKGPGWEPGKPWHGNIEDIPDVSYPVEPYNPLLPKWCTFYVLIHFAVITAAYIFMSDNHKDYHWISVTVVLAYVIFSLIILCILLDNRTNAALLEFTRCIIYLVLDYYCLPSGQLSTEGLRIFFLCSSLLWGIISFQTILHKVYIKIK